MDNPQIRVHFFVILIPASTVPAGGASRPPFEKDWTTHEGRAHLLMCCPVFSRTARRGRTVEAQSSWIFVVEFGGGLQAALRLRGSASMYVLKSESNDQKKRSDFDGSRHRRGDSVWR
jgi:hypothetical protein